MPFTVAIVGRPNVGKSTLFNRLTGKKRALVDDQPGVTRDRREGAANLAGLEFTIVDTAGLEDAAAGTLQARMTDQTKEAIKRADVTMMMIDGRAGVTPVDKHFAQLIRTMKKPVVLVVNKAEGNKAQGVASEAYALGFGEPVAISAEHGEGLADLYAALAVFEKRSAVSDQWSEEDSLDCPPTADRQPLQLAIVGRPNVGKSTLLNRILKEERVLTGPEAGITRDSIMVEMLFEGSKLKLVDTAGMRRKANVTDKVEKLAVADTLEAIRYAHVAICVIDAQQPLEKQDTTIASLIEQEGRAMVLAVNKWDTVKEPVAHMKAINELLEKVLPQVKGIPIVPISAETGSNVDKLLKTCFKAYAVWNRHIGTGELNRWLEAALDAHTPPMISGRRMKIRYMTQKTARPPTFLLFSNTSDIPEHYLRYLSNGLRETFALPGVPIRIKIKKSKNPYVDKE